VQKATGASVHPQDTLTLGRALQGEGSGCREDLYLTTHNNDKEETALSPSGFEPAILGSERPQPKAEDRAATGIGCNNFKCGKIWIPDMKANWLHQSQKTLSPEHAFVVAVRQQAYRWRIRTALTVVCKRQHI